MAGSTGRPLRFPLCSQRTRGPRGAGSTALLFLVVLLAGCAQEREHTGSSVELPLPDFVIPGAIAVLPVVEPADRARLSLGRDLYNDARLSADDSVSCASCHDLDRGGADPGNAVSVGAFGRPGRVNAPTVFNAVYNFAQFWDGRAVSLEEQIAMSMADPVEMDLTAADVVDKLGGDRALVARFRRVYREGLTEHNLVDAIAYYVRALVTPNSPFDRYLQGERSAVGQDVIDGYATFQRLGCISCHQGRNVGGNMFQRMGAMIDFFDDEDHLSDADLGRYNVTGRERDRFVFKVPGLRNVADTPPYFHDGSADTLEDAVQIMVQHQLARPATTDEVASIIAFLGSLSGELDESLR